MLNYISSYIKLLPRLKKLIGLETFVFVTFLGVCGLLNVIINVIPNPDNLALAVFVGIIKVILGALFIGAWLLLWYYLTKRLMKYSRN